MQGLENVNGCFYPVNPDGSARNNYTGSDVCYRAGLFFDAGRVVPTADEDRPTNISLVPLIAC